MVSLLVTPVFFLCLPPGVEEVPSESLLSRLCRVLLLLRLLLGALLDMGTSGEELSSSDVTKSLVGALSRHGLPNSPGAVSLEVDPFPTRLSLVTAEEVAKGWKGLAVADSVDCD